MEDIYKTHIIEHSIKPRNYGPIDGAHVCSIHNNSCGDSLNLYVVVNGFYVENVSFTGECCALATASASLFTQYIKGKKIDELRQILPKDIYDLVGITVSPQRAGCVLLPYTALQKYLE
jgi:nitrogen fixation protein NifU and related proteins